MCFELPPNTVCPRSSEPFYIETYYIKRVTTFGHTVLSGERCKDECSSESAPLGYIYFMICNLHCKHMKYLCSFPVFFYYLEIYCKILIYNTEETKLLIIFVNIFFFYVP